MLDLAVVVILSIALVPLVELTEGAARIAFGLVFVLFSPGYSLIAALFPRKGSLGGIERLALSFGLSIAVVPLIGLALNYTDWGIRETPILFSILVFILLMSLVAWYRRHRLEPDDRFQVKLTARFQSLGQSWAGQGKWDRVLTVALVIAILGAVGTLGYVVANPKVGEKFTEFYILGADGKADNYPTEIILGESAEVTVGIVNREQEPTTYTVNITIDGEDFGGLGPITLDDNEKWEVPVIFTPFVTGQDQKVEFILFNTDFNETYLALQLWVDIIQPEGNNSLG